jgi:hypothetical protein
MQSAEWPIDRATLAALIDMGLTNAQIGAYFSVGPDDVHMLRDQYGLGRSSPKQPPAAT